MTRRHDLTIVEKFSDFLKIFRFLEDFQIFGRFSDFWMIFRFSKILGEKNSNKDNPGTCDTILTIEKLNSCQSLLSDN